MANILLDHSDGRYSTRLLREEEAAELEAQDTDVAYVEDRVYDAYLRHCEQDGVWQALWQSISNEQYVRRRQQELLPLEEAQREIDRLRDALTRSERMHHHFEDAWLRATGRQTRAEHENDGAYTCIFPQPGCDIAVLESAEWRATAVELLKSYNFTLSEEGNPYQGCCCGHTHRLISPEEAKKIRAAGFLVENDAEEAPCG
jgi:hypothetical protein